MTNFIPIFPLPLVVFPGEHVNLHVFEPRYKQLIKECFEAGKPFGIPPVIDNVVKESGTLVKVVEISNTYEDGRMDIRTAGLETFKILEIIKELPGKLYSGAIVTYPENLRSQGNKSMMKVILSGARVIFKNLQVDKQFPLPDKELVSYDVAHHLGMPIEDEYLLLELNSELQRQEFLKRHIAKMLPVISELESLKKKIQMNGHFKNLEGFKFP